MNSWLYSRCEYSNSFQFRSFLQTSSLVPCMKKDPVQFHQTKTLNFTFDSVKQEKNCEFSEQCYIDHVKWEKKWETFDRTICLNYMMEVYYIHCIYSYPNYHNHMYYTAYNYPKYIFCSNRRHKRTTEKTKRALAPTYLE